MNARMWIGLALIVAAALPAAGQEEKPGVALTVYNGGYGVVREIRELTIGADGSAQFADVPSRIDATTVHFKSLTDPAAKLLEQNYQYDLVSADKLLQKHIDHPVEVFVPGKVFAGSLLSFDGRQIILKDGEGITMVERPDNVRDIRFKTLPEGLLTRPTLLWQVATDRPGKQLAEVTYQTDGMGWHAEYVLVLGAEDQTADLAGWVSVQNNSGKTYKQAKLKFIAGDVRRVAEPRPVELGALRRSRGETEQPAMVEKAFFEYHMYTLGRPSTVADNEIKQLEMFSPAQGIQVDKKYLYNPLRLMRWFGGRYTDPSYGVTSDKKVQIFIEFRNTEANKLGIPLPAGKVRAYKQDPEDKALEFVGEEQIDHTPKDEKLSLLVGNAFDVVGERKQADFKVDVDHDWMVESFEIKLRNHKKENIQVRIKEPLYRWSGWEITAKSHEYAKLDAHTIAFDVPVKADGETTVTYTVRYTW